ncbi:MAG: helix-turn-helix domain-containing protein [Actinomycetota bacterium]|nr:helix-turn-helix domain-containing protein [Actinomycetota bacterium]
MPTTDPADGGDRDDLPEPLLDIAAVAKLLGVSIRHIRRLVLEGRIPYIKWGHYIRFDRAELARWIDAYRRWPGQTA